MGNFLGYDLNDVSRAMMSDKSRSGRKYDKKHQGGSNRQSSNSGGRGNGNKGYHSDKNQGYQGGQKGREGESLNDTEKYVGAPYNFVSFTKDIYKYPEGKLTHHNDVSDELFSGEIVYRITAKNPIIVDDGSGQFCKNPQKKHIIPGSTVRGMIRSNVQVLGLSSFSDDIDDYALMYRNVASGAEKKKYNKILGVDNSNEETRGIAKNVKAGYIFLKDGNYYFNEVKETFDKDSNYLMLSSKKILSDKDSFPFFLEDWEHHMMYTADCIFERKEKIEGRYGNKYVKFIYKTEDTEEVAGCIENGEFSFEKGNVYNNNINVVSIGKPGVYEETGRVNYKNNKVVREISYEPRQKRMINKNYEPYYKPVLYKLDKSRKRVVAVTERKDEHQEQGFQEGYVLSSGWIDKKKNVYIIPEMECDIKSAIKIKPEAVMAFSVDLQRKQNSLKQYFHDRNHAKEDALAFFGLPQKEGEEGKKPAFFIEYKGGQYFGFTPRLRLFYDKKVKQGLPEEHGERGVDYSRAIFGYSNDRESYKSKVSFSDAVAINETAELPEVELILAEPKPTSYLDYLKQEDERAVTYNSPKIELRGMKQYWLRKETVKQEVDKKKEGVANKFCPLDEKIKFKGKIRFHNMSGDELGLLLWSIQLDNGKSWMNIGKAKPFGYGNISVELREVKQFIQSKAYGLDCLDLNPFEPLDVAKLIGEYKEHINQFLVGRQIEDLESIREFFAMKNPDIMPDKDKIEYMSIEKKAYQNRKKALPLVKELVKGE